MEIKMYITFEALDFDWLRAALRLYTKILRSRMEVEVQIKS